MSKTSQPTAKPVTVELGNRSFPIRPMVYRDSKAWRLKATQPLDAIATIMQTAGNLNLQNPEDLGNLLAVVRQYIAGSVEVLFELLLDYAPNIRQEQAWVEEHATDEQIMAAFIEVLKLAYPFGQAFGMISRGQPSQTTRPN